MLLSHTINTRLILLFRKRLYTLNPQAPNLASVPEDERVCHSDEEVFSEGPCKFQSGRRDSLGSTVSSTSTSDGEEEPCDLRGRETSTRSRPDYMSLGDDNGNISPFLDRNHDQLRYQEYYFTFTKWWASQNLSTLTNHSQDFWHMNDNQSNQDSSQKKWWWHHLPNELKIKVPNSPASGETSKAQEKPSSLSRLLPDPCSQFDVFTSSMILTLRKNKCLFQHIVPTKPFHPDFSLQHY